MIYHRTVERRFSEEEMTEMEENTQPKAIATIREYQQWLGIMGVRTVEDFNNMVRAGRASQLINVAEALQERKIIQIADDIKRHKARIVLIAGPSSSGKTTLSKRLAIQLVCCGLTPHTISTDNYFVNRVDTPKDGSGEYDFECIEAEDTSLFNKHMRQILAGERVELPRYDFHSGERKYEGNYLQIGSTDVVIIEGNHALNPIMSEQIQEGDKYRVYVSPLSAISIDEHNVVPTSDIRLLRRILRDYKYRGYTATQTIRRNLSVIAGERKWIYPFQRYADALFNSALLYELNVLHGQVMPLLEQVSVQEPEYAEVSRLCRFLRNLVPLPDDQVPPASLLREFAGGSSFKY